MQVGRMFEIVYLLIERGQMTAGELAKRFEVSPRTIYRDLDLLSASGIPVYASRGKGGGIGILPGFVLNKSVLSEEEQNEILFALQSLRATNASGDDGILPRIGALFQKDGADWIDVDFSSWGSPAGERKKFQLLKTSILGQELITFTYFNSSGQTTSRKVEPVRLRFKNASWYLQGFCLGKKAYRTFKIARMDEIVLTGEYFEKRSGPVPELEPAGMEYGALSTVKLWISPSFSFRVYDEFDPAQVVRNEDGSFYVTVSLPGEDWIFSYILSFGDGVRVESPPEVQRAICETAKKIASYYSNV